MFPASHPDAWAEHERWLDCPVQIVEPEWSVLFDVDADMARRTREKLLDELEGSDVAVACGHFPEAA